MAIMIPMHDEWKLATPEYTDLVTCERCDDLFEEAQVNEISFRDADGDRQNRFCCGGCTDRIFEGDF